MVIILKDGRNLGYTEYGERKGKPIFYFHGWPTSRLQAEIMDQAAKKFHARIISIDRPGYGLSDYKKDRTLLDWPDDVGELSDWLHIRKFAVVGVSGGGPYATVTAYKIPKRLTKVGVVVGLSPILPGSLDGVTFFAKNGWAHYGKHSALRKFAAVISYAMAKYGPGLGLHRFVFGSKSDRKIYADQKMRQTLQRNSLEAFRDGYKGAELDLQLYTSNWGFTVKDIRAKVYLWYGDDDRNVSLNMGRYYAAQIPNSKLTIYPGEGHLISKTHADEIIKTLVS